VSRGTESGAPAADIAAGPPSASARNIATVNGEAVGRGEFVSQLIDARGLAFLQQVLLLNVARQETSRLGLSVSEIDIEREYDLTFEADRFNGRDHVALTPARKQQLIDEWTQSRGVSRTELHLAMQRQAHLRKIAEGRLTLTDEMIAKEHERVHGEKAEVRHIQVAAPRFWNDIKQRLERGERFEEMVMQFSQNGLSREQLGLLPPFTRNDPTVPAIFAEVAFKLRPGEHSGLLEAEGSYHVIRLERIIPASGAPLDDAERAHLRRTLSARLVAQNMEQLGQSLLLAARITIEDRTLREQYKAAQTSGRLLGPPISP
jgi:parvulin-like peptidyl-prolyl isomerase